MFNGGDDVLSVIFVSVSLASLGSKKKKTAKFLEMSVFDVFGLLTCIEISAPANREGCLRDRCWES